MDIWGFMLCDEATFCWMTRPQMQLDGWFETQSLIEWHEQGARHDCTLEQPVALGYDSYICGMRELLCRFWSVLHRGLS